LRALEKEKEGIGVDEPEISEEEPEISKSE
jgi:hypothetical protein